MNARFAEPCRDLPLELFDAERDILIKSGFDGRTQKDIALKCEKDIYIGVFFDGTNNNKYRDTPTFSQSNVARLYEVYPGTPARQATPKLKARISGGQPVDRPVFQDLSFRADSVPPADFPYYRKLYIPGLGTPMPDVGDSGAGTLKTLGLATAFLGEVRLAWASLQLINQIHAAVFSVPLEDSVDMRVAWGKLIKKYERLVPFPNIGLGSLPAVSGVLLSRLGELDGAVGEFGPIAFDNALDDYQKRLAAALKQRGSNKPDLRSIRLSVFGFSRGAAAARAWVNMVTSRWGNSLAGIRLQVDFLGIFDSVASVGTTPAVPRMPGLSAFEGHGSWAGANYMPVPASVKRCVHLVAAHEVRGSFPLDSVCQGEHLPSNCKEIVYPGVHSDVGGGYPPDDQGRAHGTGTEGDQLKLSQIPLAQMYREARMAGVPLAPYSNMDDNRKRYFAIGSQLRNDFNAYVAATRSGSVPATQGKGEVTFARMYPTETQPREELFRVLRRHHGYSLRWRKRVLPQGAEQLKALATTGAGGAMATLKVLADEQAESKYQDREDIRGAEQELAKEIAFLQSTDPKKFESIDDPLESLPATAALLGRVPWFFGAIAPAATSWVFKTVFPQLMREKQRQWDTWLRDEWSTADANALPAAAVVLFEKYVHDSRAWFKPLVTSDGSGLAPDDEDWFVFGGRDAANIKRRKALSGCIASTLDPNVRAAAKAELRALDQEGQPLIKGGREAYRMWGYIRHRAIYQSGRLSEKDSGIAQQHQVDAEEDERARLQRRADQTEKEAKRHQEELDRITAESRKAIENNRPDAEQDYWRGKIDSENRFHAARLKNIETNNAAAQRIDR